MRLVSIAFFILNILAPVFSKSALKTIVKNNFTKEKVTIMSDRIRNSNLLVALKVICAVLPVLLDDEEPIPFHNSVFTGRLYAEELMDHSRTHPERFREVNRMDRRTFRLLVTFLKDRTEFRDTRYLSAEEQLMIYIHTSKFLFLSIS